MLKNADSFLYNLFIVNYCNVDYNVIYKPNIGGNRMKKIVSLLLAVMMIASLGVSAFADTDPELFTSNPKLGTPTSKGKVYCYKSPIGETAAKDGQVIFIAKAANDTDMTWYVKLSDGTVCTLDELESKFDGLSVQYNSSSSKDEILLKHLPLELNGAQFQAKFEGEDGPVYSSAAMLYVNENTYNPYNDYMYWAWVNQHPCGYPWYGWGYPWWWGCAPATTNANEKTTS